MSPPNNVTVKVEDLRDIRRRLENAGLVISRDGNMGRDAKVQALSHLKRGKEVLDGYLQLGLFSPQQRR